MFHLAEEDIPVVQEHVDKAILALSNGATRIDLTAIEPVKVTGYWVKDMMRIDIKLKGDKIPVTHAVSPVVIASIV